MACLRGARQLVPSGLCIARHAFMVMGTLYHRQLRGAAHPQRLRALLACASNCDIKLLKPPHDMTTYDVYSLIYVVLTGQGQG